MTDLAAIYPSPVSAEEVEATRRPTLEAHTLPARVFTDPAVFAWEMAAWYGRDWLMIGRVDDLPEVGSFFRATVAGEDIIVARGTDGGVRAFYNVCRHRGATLVEQESGRVGGFACPYHAWTYDLQGNLRRPAHTDRLQDFACEEFGLNRVPLATLAGFIFVSFDPEPQPFNDFAGELPELLARFRLDELRRVERAVYPTAANWKVIAENALECYHCPGVHPLLNKLTPPGMGGVVSMTGDWSFSWMELGVGFATMSIDGQLNGRPVIPALDGEDLRRVSYVWIWPNLLFAINPDYMRSLQFWPVDAEHSVIHYDVYFHPDAINQPDFDPSGVLEFAHLIVNEDIHPCELQQRGLHSRGYRPGRYAQIEGATHRFDAKVADRYASDGRQTDIDRRGDYFLSPSANRSTRDAERVPADD